AQLGDRRSLATPIATKVKLTVMPTRRVSGKASLGPHKATQAIVVVEDPNDHTDHFQLIAPVNADGSFSVDGVPTSKVEIAIGTESRATGTQLQYSDVPASQEAVTGLALSLETTVRKLDIIARSTLTTPLDAAQVIVLPGHVKLANVGELIKHDMGGLLTQF